MVGLVPSILSADFTRLGEQVREAEAAGAQRIQVDVMDGHFVPNITMGPMVVEAVRRCTGLPLEAHLMITNPEQYIENFAAAGADVIIVHQEVCPHLNRVIHQIKTAGKMAGVAFTKQQRRWLCKQGLTCSLQAPLYTTSMRALPRLWRGCAKQFNAGI